ncbi:MAG: HD-GYP domain-containing protein [Candidatus Omnitrophota bacterium]|nr:HD-GYP domain-containing protein [Candidatus Omnitrophota bacterium]
MTTNLSLNILDLGWLSKIMGAHLSMENLMQEISIFLRSRLHARRSKVFLWDDKKKTFVKDQNKKNINLVVNRKMLLNSLQANEPVITKTNIFIPLKARGKSLGVVVLDSFTFSIDSTRYTEEITFLTKIVEMLLTNANFFIEYERINKDLFKFNVLNRALNPRLDEEGIAKILKDGVKGMINFDLFGLLLLGKSNPRLYIAVDKPVTKGNINILKVNLTEFISNLTQRKISCKELIEKSEIPKGNPVKMRVSSFLNAPLITKDKIIGAMLLANYSKESFTYRDQQSISLLASQAAIALENEMLYGDLQRTYFSIVKALTSAIEVKDPYTQGHSVLVSCYAEAIAKEMGLSVSMVESVKIAGLLHDLGKIGVPEEILLKMQKLTSAEYEVIKAHPDIAIKILKSVEFPHFTQEIRNLEMIPELTLNLFEPADLSAEVKLMIYHHHEKYAGGGYPKGLKNDKIPLGARILAVADTFEALTASRPYRKAFSVQEAKKILIKASGGQLDPKMVKAFLNVLKKKSLRVLRAQVGL